MSKIIFLTMKHSQDEILMGTTHYFTPFKKSMECNAISATANTGGFTPLTAIIRCYNWDTRMIGEATRECNRRGEIAVIDNVQPNLLLVPKTRGKNENDFLISDLLKACKAIGQRILRFTHYGFIQSKLPKEEIITILKYIKDNSSSITLEKIYWDIDSRQREEMKNLYEKLFENEAVFLF